MGEFGGHGNIAAMRVAMHVALMRRGIDPREVFSHRAGVPPCARGGEKIGRGKEGNTDSMIMIG